MRDNKKKITFYYIFYVTEIMIPRRLEVMEKNNLLTNLPVIYSGDT